MRASGSWPKYYDSLRTFSPARFSAIPGWEPISVDPDSYPERDAVAAYLEGFARSLDVDIRTNTRVADIVRSKHGFLVRTSAGEDFDASAVVAASGSFSNPRRPALPGQDSFTGEILHVVDYSRPDAFAGQRVVVVGGGNSAVQVGHELAQIATVTLATNNPINFVDQRPDGRDLHHLLVAGFDQLPPEWFIPFMAGPLTIDIGNYRAAFEAAVLDRRQVFAALDGDHVIWSNGSRERVDTVLLATGYRPNLGYLATLGAVDERGNPKHKGGISTTHPGLAYVGLEFQRTFASNTLRGVDSDARFIAPALRAYADRLHVAFR